MAPAETGENEVATCEGCHYAASIEKAASGISPGRAAERQDQVLDDGWRFVRDDAGLSASTDRWQSVTLPHTWNTKSADEGDHKGDPHFKSGYYRGACWYARMAETRPK